jgi:hypothetical protein
MRAGFYADELEEVTDTDNIEIAAIWFADKNHEITDGDDVDFEVFNFVSSRNDQQVYDPTEL